MNDKTGEILQYTKEWYLEHKNFCKSIRKTMNAAIEMGKIMNSQFKRGDMHKAYIHLGKSLTSQ